MLSKLYQLEAPDCKFREHPVSAIKEKLNLASYAIHFCRRLLFLQTEFSLGYCFQIYKVKHIQNVFQLQGVLWFLQAIAGITEK